MAITSDMNVRSAVDLIASDFAYKNDIQVGDLLETWPDNNPQDENGFPSSLALVLGREPLTQFEHTTRNINGTFVNGVKLPQWEVVKTVQDSRDGFGAVILKSKIRGFDGKFDYIVALRGTDGRDPQDWFANLDLAATVWDAHSAEIVSYLTNLQATGDIPRLNRVHFTGQSLGGGMAQYAAYDFALAVKNINPDFRADMTLTTFNAFGGVRGLQQLAAKDPARGPYDPTLINSDVATAHYSIDNDLVHRIGKGAGDVAAVGGSWFVNGKGNTYHLGFRRLGADGVPAPEPRNYLDLFSAHRIEAGFYRGFQNFPGDFRSATPEIIDYIDSDASRSLGAALSRIANKGFTTQTSAGVRLAVGAAAIAVAGNPVEITRAASALAKARVNADEIGSAVKETLAIATVAVFTRLAATTTGELILAGTLFATYLERQAGLSPADKREAVAALNSFMPADRQISQKLVADDGLPSSAEAQARFRLAAVSFAAMLSDGSQAADVLDDDERKLAALLHQAGISADDLSGAVLSSNPRSGVDAAVSAALKSNGSLSLGQRTALAASIAGHVQLVADAAGAADAAYVSQTREETRGYLVGLGKSLANTRLQTKYPDANDALFANANLAYTDYQQYRDGLVAAMDDPANASVRDLIGEALTFANAGGEFVVVRRDASANPTAAITDPSAIPAETSQIAESGAQLYTAFLPYAAAPGGQRIRMQVAGASVESIAESSGANFTQLDGSGTFDVMVGEGQRQVSFVLVQNKNISQNSTLTMSATLLDASGNPMQQPGVIATVGLTATDEGSDTPETSYSIFGDQTGNSHDAYGNVINGDPAPGRNDFLNGSPGNDRIEGLGGDDAVNADGGDDYVLGGDGNDTLAGQDGNDRIEGGAGRDFVLGGTGNDLILGQDGNDSLLAGNEGDDRIYGGTQADDATVFTSDTTNALPGEAEWLDGGDGKDRLIGTAYDNVMLGGAGEDVLAGGAGNDFLYGDRDVVIDPPLPIVLGTTVTLSVGDNNTAGGDDVLLGGGGDDSIEGGVGADTLFGDAGDDTMFGDANGLPDELGGGDFMDGGAGNDNLHGQQGNDALYGGAGDDTLQGDDPNQAQGDDYLSGEDGNDVLIGAGGNDILYGGAGNDELHGDGDNVPLAQQGKDELYGGDGDDAMNGYGGDDLLDGGAGADTMFGGLGKDRLLGGAGNDQLTGDEGTSNPDGGDADFMDGGAGDDFLFGQGGDDQMFGGAGKDWLQAGVGNDQLYGGADDDVLFGEGGNDRVDGGDGSDELHGGDGVDVVLGGAGDDKLFGEDGADTLSGNGGDDRIQAGVGDDTASGGDGNDLMFGEGGNDILSGDEGDDELQGNTGDDNLDGGEGNDTLFGGEGIDVLLGGGGDDYLEGGQGPDQLVGGDGYDSYFYQRGDGIDHIVDSGDNAIGFGPGITLFDIGLAIGSLELDLGNGDQIHIDGFDPNDPFNTSSITEFRFDDGTVATLAQLLALGFDIDGTPAADTLSGTPVNDRIHAFESDDTVDAKAGDDMVDAGDGNDTVNAGEGNDTVLAGDGADIVYGGKGNDDLEGDLGDDQLYGEKGVDTLHGGEGDDMLDGGIDGDALYGDAGDDQLYGGKGDDRLEGGDGADLLVGGTGDDLYIVDAQDTVLENTGEGIDTVDVGFAYTLPDNVENLTMLSGTGDLEGTGNELDNDLIGNEGDNALYGLGGDDLLRGGGGNDYLDGGTGADGMIGMDGDDTYVVDNEDDTVAELADFNEIIVIVGQPDEIIHATGGVDTVLSSIDYTLGQDVENLTLTEPAAGQSAATAGRGNIEQNVIVGNDADNLLTAYTLNHRSDNRENAFLEFGTPFNGASERLADRAAQGIYKGELQDTDFENIGTMLYLSAHDGDTLVGGAGNDTLLGDLDNDTLEGGSGNDLLFGFGGADTLVGGEGDDTYVVEEGYSYAVPVNGSPTLAYLDYSSDTLVENEGEGIDTVLAAIDYTLPDNIENLTLIRDTYAYQQDIDVYGVASPNYAAQLADVAHGNALDNVITANDDTGAQLWGEDGNDTLIGGDLADDLHGGAGDDAMVGGAGDDLYEVDSVGDQVTEAAGEGTDLVETWLDQYTLGDNVEDLTFLSAADSTGTGNELANAITGGDGNDALYGLAGDDILDGAFGDDAMAGGTGDDTYYVDSEFDSVSEAADEGYDRVYSSVSFELGDNFEALYLTGQNGDFGVGNDLDNLIVGDDSWNELDGLGGDDVIDGGDGNDALYGGDGNDLLDGGFGDDYMEGGASDDTYRVDSFSDQVVEFADEGIDTVEEDVSFYTLPDNVENATVTGSFEVDGGFPYNSWSVEGNSLDNRILGNDAYNQINAGEGDDTVDGFSFDDSITGGDGNDVLYGGDDFVMSGEALDAAGGGEGGIDPLAQVIVPNADYIDGGAGDDQIDGGSGNDTLYGGDGNDRLYGGDDGAEVELQTAVGPEGGIEYVGDSGVLFVGDGWYIDNTRAFLSNDDYLDGGAGDDVLDGGSGSDQLYGGDGEDQLYGGEDGPLNFGNSDYLDGGAGIDFMAGGTGDDTYIVDGFFTETTDLPVYDLCGDLVPGAVTRLWTTDTVLENVDPGYDTVYSSADFVLPENVEELILQPFSDAVLARGNASDNFIHGNENDNRLEGGAGDDELHGDAGDDIVDGGDGNDFLDGGAGNDTYLFGASTGRDLVSPDGGGFDIVHVDAALDPADLVLSRNGDDVTIAAPGSGARMTLSNWFNQPTVQEIEFCDDTVWDAQTIASLANAHLVDAQSDSGFVQEDEGTPVTGNVLDNDSGSFGLLSVTNPGTYAGQYGTLTLAADGSYTYVLDDAAVQWLGAFQGLDDTFVYDMQDEALAGDSATLDIFIQGTNDDPLVTAAPGGDGATLTEDALLFEPNGEGVENGSFETGDFTGWTFSGDPSSYSLFSFFAADGIYSAGFFTSGTPDLLAQDLDTIAGQHYQLSFFLADGDTQGAEFSVRWNGTLVASQSNVFLPDFTSFQYDVVAGEGPSHLEFSLQDDVGDWVLDAISVRGPFVRAPETQDASGTLTFTDVDIDDTHGVFVNQEGPDYVGFFDAQLVADSTGNATGKVNWTFSVYNEDIDYLAEGEVLEQRYDVNVEDGWSFGTQTVTIRLVGTNDAPVIDGADDAADFVEDDGVPAQGAIDFGDVDLADAHTVGVTPQEAGYLGTFQAVLSEDSTGSGYGFVDWSFDADPGAIDFLADGETLTQSYDVTIDDGHAGGTATQTVEITLVGTNDAPVLEGGAGAVTEDATLAEVVAGPELLANGGFESGDFSGWTLGGAVDFTDVDDVTPASGGFAADFGAIGAQGFLSQALATTAGQQYVLDFRLRGGGTEGASFSVSWNGEELGSLADEVLDDYTDFEFLVGGIDGDSTLAFAFRNDPELWQLDDVSLRPLELQEVLPDVQTASGTLAFTDADLSDTHDVFVDPEDAGYLGALSVSLADSTGTGTGAIDWEFQVDNSALQYLAEGETLTQVYDVTLEDALIDTAQTLTITLTGVNDAPVATGGDSAGEVVEDASPGGTETTGGTLAFSDADLADAHTVATHALGTGYLGTFGAQLVADSTGGATGSLDWSFAVDDVTLQFLAEGELLTQAYAVTIDDGHAGGTAIPIVTVTLVGTNDAPVAFDDAASAQEDGAVTASGNLLGNDTDPDHGTVLSVDNPGLYAGRYGTLVLRGDGSYDYLLDNGSAAVQRLHAGERVSDEFDYQASDGFVDAGATLVVSIAGANDAPATADDAASVSEDATLSASGNVLANDSDVDHDTVLAVASAGTYAGSYGTLVLAADGSYTYTLDNAAVQFLHGGETVADDFSYAASDGLVATPGALAIAIAGANDAPVAFADAASVREDGPLTASGNVLANDTDADHDTVLAVANAGTYVGAYGTLVLAADGSYTYTLDDAAVQSLGEGQSVSDTFGYTATDGELAGSSSLTVTIAGANDAPAAGDDSADVQEDVRLTATGNVIANDGDADAGTTLQVQSPGSYAGAYGTLALASDGSYTYALDNGAPGVQALAAGQVVSDVFAYQASDGITSSQGTLTVSIAGSNDAPLTVDDLALVSEDGATSATGNVLGNDSDIDSGTTLSVSNPGTYAGSYGTLTLNGDGSYDYLLDNGSSAVQSLQGGQVVFDTFAYEASDGLAHTAGALSVRITGANDTPVAVDDAALLREDAIFSASGNLLANDSDVDAGTALAILNPGTYAIGFGTVYANITVQSNGDYTLALDNAAVQSLGQGQSLRQAFFYTVSDGYVATPPALPSDRAFGTLDITIEGANDAPVTLADTAGVTEDGPLTASGNVLANDSDVDQGTTLAVGTPGTFAGAYGTLAISVDGSYTYTLDNGAAAVQALREGQTALERFDYAASDGFTSTPGSLTVTVTGANDAPLAAADSASLQEDFLVTASGNVLVNDRDPDAGTVLAAVLMGSSAGAYGTLALGSDGSYTYVLANASSAVQGLHAGQVVTDTFAYAATDGLASSTSALTITITGANDAPFTAPDTASVGEDGVLSASGNVLGNDSDADAGTTLAVSNAGTYAGTYGTLTLGADGGYGYALNNGANAVQSLRAGQVVSDVFAYTASDGIVGTPGSLTVSVTGANDAPLLATPIADQSANAGAPFSFTFAANTFTDIDQGDVLSYRASLADGSPLPSWLSFDGATRTFTGTPPGGGGDGCGCDCGGGATTADIRVTATDLASASASDVFTLSVSGGGDGGGGRLIVGTAGNDVLTGTACDDVIDGRQGGDTMSGGKGDDTYFVDQSCASGHGNEGVGNGEDPPPPGHDYNQNDGPGTSPGNPGSSPYNGSSQGGSDCSGPGCVADLVVEKANEGYDTVYASVDYTLPDNVEEVHLLGCDNLDATGNGLANVLEGNSGDNVLSGGAGADTYVYSLGGGKDVIDEKGAAGQTDTLKLQGMAASSVRLARSGNNLVVDFPGRDGRVTLKDWFSSSANRVERFQFDDGTVWDEAKIRSQVGKKVAPVYGDSSPVSYPDQRRADDCHGSSSGGDPHDDGCGSSRYDDTCRSDTDEAILRRLRQPVSFSFDEIMQALGDTGPTLSAAEIARRWAAARSYFCDDGDCHDSQADAFPSLKDLGLSLASQTGCGFGFEGSTGEQGSCGGMQSFQGLSEGFRRL